MTTFNHSSRTRRVLALLPFLLLGATNPTVSAQTAKPAAVVLEISGSSTPAVAVRQELVTGTQISLAPGTRLTLLHYSACSVVTIAGGTVSVSASGVAADGGSVQSRKQGPCPRIHSLSSEGTRSSSGALVLRGGSPFLLLAPHLEAILAGQFAISVSSAEVLDSERNVVVSAWSVDEAALKSSAPLAVGKLYVLRLRRKDATEALDVPFQVSRQTDFGSSILRIE